MVSAFGRLSALVDAGDVRLVEIQAVPRSLSTALGRCLNESPSGGIFVNEPFNTTHTDIDGAARHVLRAVEPALSDVDRPITVVTKNMARNLPAAVTSRWTEVCTAVVWCVRDPRVQVSSLITRTVNDLLFGIGADRIRQAALQSEQVMMASDFLEASPASTNFSKTGWQDFGVRFDRFPPDRRRVISDAAVLASCPDRLLRYVCDGVGLAFRDRIIDGWTQPYCNVNRVDNPDVNDAADAWIKDAATSHGIHPTAREPLDVETLPPSLRRHLLEVAMPTYQRVIETFCADATLSRYGLDLDDCPAN